jgi:LmbE family N-acetylglucosaminyl deacetylase
VRRLYLFWPDAATCWVDVTATIDRRIEALACHVSQVREPELLAARLREWAAEEGEPIGAAAGEAFRLIMIDDEPVGEDAPRG